MSGIIARVDAALCQARCADTMKGTRLRTPVVRDVSAKVYREIRGTGAAGILAFCEELLEAGDSDMRLIAFDWAFRLRKLYRPDEFSRFERWLFSYVDGWASCDDFCTHALGALVCQMPSVVHRIQPWTASESQWVRRGSVVSLIYAGRRGALIEESLVMADRLLGDPEDLVQKGVGWLLKEIGKRQPDIIFDYVMARRGTMPRTSLRYAIEKLPPEQRRQAMGKPK